MLQVFTKVQGDFNIYELGMVALVQQEKTIRNFE